MRDDYHMLDHNKFFNVRMPKELHQDFVEACKVMKVKPSNFIRNSMIHLIEESEEQQQPNITSKEVDPSA